MVVAIILDVLLFKLAFHTYEVLKNKQQIIKRNKAKDAKNNSDSDEVSDANTELDLISNNSDESTMTLGGPAPIREKKIERYDENLDVKLNTYLMKWIVVICFFNVQFVFNFLSIALPAMPALKLILGFWIMLPQMRGEFYFFNMIESYIIIAERYLLEKRSQLCSAMVLFFIKLQKGSLKVMVSYISEECVVQSQEACQQSNDILKREVEMRIE